MPGRVTGHPGPTSATRLNSVSQDLPLPEASKAVGGMGRRRGRAHRMIFDDSIQQSWKQSVW